MSSYTISLEHIRLFGYHGIHPEETLAGGEFDVDMQVRFSQDNKITQLHETVDYTVIYTIVREIMHQPTPLLETLCWEIGTAVKDRFQDLSEINITISKINPPVGNFQGQLKVSWHKQY